MGARFSFLMAVSCVLASAMTWAEVQQKDCSTQPLALGYIKCQSENMGLAGSTSSAFLDGVAAKVTSNLQAIYTKPGSIGGADAVFSINDPDKAATIDLTSKMMDRDGQAGLNQLLWDWLMARSKSIFLGHDFQGLLFPDGSDDYKEDVMLMISPSGKYITSGQILDLRNVIQAHVDNNLTGNDSTPILEVGGLFVRSLEAYLDGVARHISEVENFRNHLGQSADLAALKTKIAQFKLSDSTKKAILVQIATMEASNSQTQQRLSALSEQLIGIMKQDMSMTYSTNEQYLEQLSAQFPALALERALLQLSRGVYFPTLQIISQLYDDHSYKIDNHVKTVIQIQIASAITRRMQELSDLSAMLSAQSLQQIDIDQVFPSGDVDPMVLDLIGDLNQDIAGGSTDLSVKVAFILDKIQSEEIKPLNDIRDAMSAAQAKEKSDEEAAAAHIESDFLDSLKKTSYGRLSEELKELK